MSKIIHRLTPLLVALATLAALAIPAVAQEAGIMPLTKRGLYAVGQRTLIFNDQNRKGREVVTDVWYPAIASSDTPSQSPTWERDAKPDAKGAPYPLILYSHGHGSSRSELNFFTYHLASHGFVVVTMTHKGDTDFPPLDAVDRPMDILFVLDQLAKLSTGDLIGMIDTNHVGVAGYSEGGLTALEVTGAQRDEAYHNDWCTKYPTAYPRLCGSTEVNAQITVYRAQFDPPLKAGELWPPFADKRIRAALSLAGGPGPFFGERGLAAATVPTFVIAGTSDTAAPYEWAAVYVYNHLGSKDKYLLSLMDADHHFGYSATAQFTPVVFHFGTAFFGYYLQGKQDYAQYLTAKYVDNLEAQSKLGLVWGPYQK